MARLSPLQKKLKLKNKSASAKQQQAQAQAETVAVTLPKGKHIDLAIEDFSHDGRGVGRWHGKTVFVKGALPNEVVQAKVVEDRKSYAEAELLDIRTASAWRVPAPCAHYADCGGCQIQHLQANQQVGLKQQAIAQQMQRIAKLEVPTWAAPIAGDSDGYRRRAHLATRYFKDSHKLLLGFREAGGRHIVPVDNCLVLEASLNRLLAPLNEAILQAQNPAIYSHVELLQADADSLVVLPVQADSVAADEAVWQAFADQWQVGVEVRLNNQEKRFFGAADGQASYAIQAAPEQPQLTINFASEDFIQVNGQANQAMVQQAMAWLDVQPQDQLLDLFSGAGNFALPAASLGADVVGIEGDTAMVQRAKDNAKANNLTADFKQTDLFAKDVAGILRPYQFNKVILDPPRAGAKGVERLLRNQPIEKLVYISCNPASMARDLQGLQKLGLKLVQAGAIDMFPHTPHLEVMALLEKA
jgi:23S rRNA (uracil1939-C5)-methyltransferase